MTDQVERRQEWHRVIGINRRGAPIGTLEGKPLPDPTRLIDEDFEDAAWERDHPTNPVPLEERD